MSGVEREPVTIAKSRQAAEGMQEGLPKKTVDIRKKHMVVKDSCEIEQHIDANDRSIPGILTNRGCAYAGSKGVVFGPIKDILHITHGPIGCAYFTWGTRRNLMSQEEGRDSYAGYCLSTDVKETDIVFGAEKSWQLPSGKPMPSSSRNVSRSSAPPHWPHRRRYRIRLQESRRGSQDKGHPRAL